MSVFTENYQKLQEGYNKILACIDSLNDEDQLNYINNMTNNWINLADMYCDQVYNDKSGGWKWTRKKNANALGDAVKTMFDDINNKFRAKGEELLQNSLYTKEYEGKFKPVRIKNLSEMI